MTQLSITDQQVSYIEWLLTQLHYQNPNQYLALTNYPDVKNTFTWFLRQRRKGCVHDLTISQGAYMIDTLKDKLNII